MKKNLLLLFALVSCLAICTQAQVSITNAAVPYTQDFNTLPTTGTTNANTTLPTGWTFSETGTSGNTTYGADNGGSNAGNTYSYGTTASTERAFGSLQSGSVIPVLGVGFTNNSGAAITSLTINYVGEEWRLGVANRAFDTLNFQFSTDATGLTTGTWTDENNLDFLTPNTTGTVGAIDGNVAGNRTSKSFTISGFTILPGASIWLRWVDGNVASSDDGLAIDDVTITFNGAAVSPCAEPTAQPTNLLLTPTPTTITGNFTASVPPADGYFIVRSISSTLSASPADGGIYQVGQAFGGGVVIASSDAVTFTDINLTPVTTYYYFIFAYNSENCSSGPNYLSTNPLTNSIATLSLPPCIAPTSSPTGITLSSTNTTISGTFTGASGANRYLVVRSSDNIANLIPVNGTTYTVNQFVGNDTVISYNSSTSFVATGLRANTTYYFFIYGASGDCSGEPFYNSTPLNAQQTTTNAIGLPPAYYTTATGLTCQPLKTELKNIISTGTQVLSYTPGLWQAYQFTDIRRNDANTANIIWDMYSDNPTGPEPYTYTWGVNQCGNYSSEGNCYNREHSFPQSWFNEGSPMVSDLHHIFPTDGEVNNYRSNYPYGEVSVPTILSLNGSKLGPNTFPGYSGTVFEPINEYKGDLARATLYMAVRYEDLINNWYSNGNAGQILLSPAEEPDAVKRKLQVFDTWHLQLLFKWHNLDPVSAKEIDRNNAVYYSIVNDGGNKKQGNRNPFVDHPEYAPLIFQCTGVVPITLVDFNATIVNNSVLLKWYATFETNFKNFIIERSTDGTSFFEIGTVDGRNLANYSFIDYNLPSKNIIYYRLKMVDKDGKYSTGKTIAVRLSNNINNALVYPNPVAGILNVTLTKSLDQNSQLEILDITGRRMISKKLAGGTIHISMDVSKLASGRYFIKIVNNKESINESFVVAK